MILAGDEISRTQKGNNNAYCQDNEITWTSWELDENKRRLLKFVRKLITFRKKHPVLHKRKFFQGRPIRGLGIKDIIWLKPDGCEMNDEEWNNSYARSLGMFLAGKGLQDMDEEGRYLHDSDLLIFFNAHHEDVDFTIPELNEFKQKYYLFIDTSNGENLKQIKSGDIYKVKARSIAIFTTEEEEEE